MNKQGYLVNDLLTCIPNTKTFWHDLLEWIPGLQDKCNGDYKTLVSHINSLPTPDYIIRNASWFEPLNHNCPTISLLQDPLTGKYREQQLRVCDKSSIIVCNSQTVFEQYKHEIDVSKTKIIPLGVDFDLFKPLPEPKRYDVIFVGADSVIKNFELVRHLIHAHKHLKFCVVMKYKCTEKFPPNVTLFSQVDHTQLVKLYNQSRVLICTSRNETQHLAGIEAAACDVPIVTTSVGIYPHLKGSWGVISLPSVTDFYKHIQEALNTSFTPRQTMIDNNLSKTSCKESWTQLIREL